MYLARLVGHGVNHAHCRGLCMRSVCVINFVGGNFRDCQSTMKIMKIKTRRKLPAIRYYMYAMGKANNLVKHM